MVGLPGAKRNWGDDMDVLHRMAMAPTDPPAGGDSGAQPLLGGDWLVISALVLLAASAIVFLCF